MKLSKSEALRVKEVSTALLGASCEHCVYNIRDTPRDASVPQCGSPRYLKVFDLNGKHPWLTLSFVYEKVCKGKWYEQAE